MVSAPSSLCCFGDLDPTVFRRLLCWVGGRGRVEVSDTALRDHGFDLRTAEGIGEEFAELQFGLGGIFDDLGVDEDLVGRAETEVFVLPHQFAVLLRSFGPHGRGGVVWVGSRSIEGEKSLKSFASFSTFDLGSVRALGPLGLTVKPRWTRRCATLSFIVAYNKHFVLQQPHKLICCSHYVI